MATPLIDRQNVRQLYRKYIELVKTLYPVGELSVLDVLVSPLQIAYLEALVENAPVIAPVTRQVHVDLFHGITHAIAAPESSLPAYLRLLLFSSLAPRGVSALFLVPIKELAEDVKKVSETLGRYVGSSPLDMHYVGLSAHSDFAGNVSITGFEGLYGEGGTSVQMHIPQEEFERVLALLSEKANTTLELLKFILRETAKRVNKYLEYFEPPPKI